MGKKLNLILAGLAFAVSAAFLMVERAETFCVYNKTDKTIFIRQLWGNKTYPGYRGTLEAGGHGCCDWQDAQCNKGGKEDSEVGVFIEYKTFERYEWRWIPICNDFPIKAGGWLTVVGEKGNYRCEAHDPQ